MSRTPSLPLANPYPFRVTRPIEVAGLALPGRILALFLSDCVNAGLCLSFLICRLWIIITSGSGAAVGTKRVYREAYRTTPGPCTR